MKDTLDYVFTQYRMDTLLTLKIAIILYNEKDNEKRNSLEFLYIPLNERNFNERTDYECVIKYFGNIFKNL